MASLKIAAGLFAGSAAVLADGLDSISDVIISGITLAASIIISRPPDREHPYGHYRAETLASSILAFAMFFIGGQLFILTMEKIIFHGPVRMPGIEALYATIISITGKGLLAWSQFYLGKKANSTMLKANGKNMLNDIITSVVVLAGLAVVFFLGIPLVDMVIAAVIGLWIMISAILIFKEVMVELMDGQESREPYRAIFQAVREVSGAANPHRARIRKLGAMYVIDLDIEVDGNMTVINSHAIATRIEREIKEKIDNVLDIVIHIEPLGNLDTEEGYGLSSEDIPAE